LLDEAVNSSETNRPYSVDEVIALYPKEWILMRVTEHDDEGWPSRGYVLAHSMSRDDISDVFQREPARADMPLEVRHQPYYIFRAFPRSKDPNDPGYIEAAERFAAQLESALSTARVVRRG
jgi:hypothetical protein